MAGTGVRDVASSSRDEERWGRKVSMRETRCAGLRVLAVLDGCILINCGCFGTVSKICLQGSNKVIIKTY